jgi:hypothetical protein
MTTDTRTDRPTTDEEIRIIRWALHSLEADHTTGRTPLPDHIGPDDLRTVIELLAHLDNFQKAIGTWSCQLVVSHSDCYIVKADRP